MHFVIIAACTAGGGHSADGRSSVLGGGKDAGNTGTGVSDETGSNGGRREHRTGADSGSLSPTLVPVASAEAAESGTRLRAIWQVAEDGAKQFLFQWRDTQRNEDCSFVLAGDGVLRCMPATSINFAGYFSNAECTQRLFYRAANNACVLQGTVIGALGEYVGCDYRSRRFAATAIARPSTVYLLNSESACVSTPATPSFDYFAGGAEIPSSSFVAATNQVE